MMNEEIKEFFTDELNHAEEHRKFKNMAEDYYEYFDKAVEAYQWAIQSIGSQKCEENYPICRECEHYDNEKHYCPRFCQVIKDTLAETQSSEDCISRQAVIDYAKDTCVDLDKYEDTEIFCDEIKAMPSVTPQRQKGKWIKCKSRVGVYFKCSECGKKLNWIDRDDNYCNNCGSDNSESTNEWFKEWDTSIAEMSGGREDADSN